MLAAAPVLAQSYDSQHRFRQHGSIDRVARARFSGPLAEKWISFSVDGQSPVDGQPPFLPPPKKEISMTNPVELVLLAAKIKRRTRDAEILAPCEGAEKHLAKGWLTRKPVSNAESNESNAVSNMSNKPITDRKAYLRDYMRKYRAKGFHRWQGSRPLS
jgi:hypothetical protein